MTPRRKKTSRLLADRARARLFGSSPLAASPEQVRRNALQGPADEWPRSAVGSSPLAAALDDTTSHVRHFNHDPREEA